MFTSAVLSRLAAANGRIFRRASTAGVLLAAICTNAYAGLSPSNVNEIHIPALAGGGPADFSAAGKRQTSAGMAVSRPVFSTMTAGGSAAPSSSAADAPVRTKNPDWGGIWLDTGVILGSQIAAAGVTYVLPESFSGWSEEQKRSGFDKYWRNFGVPVMDKDKYYVNYIIHPYWGATYYTRGRERGLDKTSSFLYSVAMSTMFEYGAECFAEKPSIQDLIVTPVAGSLLGAYLFEPLRQSIKSKQELRWYDHALLVATDPIGLLSLGVEKMFGIESTVTVDYSISKVYSAGTGESAISSNVRLSLNF